MGVMFIPRAISPFVKNFNCSVIFPTVLTAAFIRCRRRVRIRHGNYKIPVALIIGLHQRCFYSCYGVRVVNLTSCCHFILRWNFWGPIGHVILFSEAMPPYCVRIVVLLAVCADIVLAQLISVLAVSRAVVT